MDVVYGILVVLHLLGWAMVFGGALAGMRTATLNPGVLHGILTALLTGILLTGLASADVVDRDVDTTKIAVKLVVALAVTVLVVLGRRQGEKVTKGWLGAIAGLTALNVAVAVLW
ncbi:hypothetical protein GC089_05085 [Cellulomonas sp. JZ18]|uniref:hypothetical protein n=1 Tax=Cellulomonas sp. JZ18 TaxID=2654191 RepID=UPI0012D4375B|nr:hypothetical protein [Cellulomonas sp. JZ18]QGQ18736.1 hypothetical protein GC089_05085 [Cellulomonas sp. JZ18]